jgi:serpin B
MTHDPLTEDLRFCLSLQRRMSTDPSQTLCWSPFSVTSALNLAARCARGTTREELSHAVMGNAHGDLDWHVKALGEAAFIPPSRHPAGGNPGPTVAVSNTLWADDRFALREESLHHALGPCGGVVRRVPFSASPQQAVATINHDVADKTRGLIPSVLTPDAVDSSTVAALVNALYLKTSWKTPFEEHATAPGPFATPDGPVQVAMMRATARMRYGHRNGWQIVDIPAKGGVSATVLLPDAALAEAEPALNSHVLGDMIDSAAPELVDVTVPRLALDFRTSLIPALGALGVRALFGNECDLSVISDEPMHVSAVGHQAVLRLNEAGIEGAAITSMQMIRSAAGPRSPVTVTIDRPFLLLVRRGAAMYFLARVTRP